MAPLSRPDRRSAADGDKFVPVDAAARGDRLALDGQLRFTQVAAGALQSALRRSDGLAIAVFYLLHSLLVLALSTISIFFVVHLSWLSCAVLVVHLFASLSWHSCAVHFVHLLGFSSWSSCVVLFVHLLA